MLLELAQWLARDVRLFNVFNYITLRAVLACLTALAISLILGPFVIRKLTAYKIGQSVTRVLRYARGWRNEGRPGDRRDGSARWRSRGTPGAIRGSVRDTLSQSRHRCEQSPSPQAA